MKSVVVSLLLLFCISVNGQKLIVEKFDLKTNDVTARTHPRQDINGNDCALIKVQLAASNAIFDGNVIGDVAYETSIYMVGRDTNASDEHHWHRVDTDDILTTSNGQFEPANYLV